MSQSTWAVKIDDEEKERLSQLIDDSNLTSKDFLAQMIAVYELSKARDSSSILAQDFDELLKLTQRINSLFTAVGERVETYSVEQQHSHQNEQEKKQGLIDLLQEKVDSLTKDNLQQANLNKSLSTEYDDLRKERSEQEEKYTEQVEQFRLLQQNQTELIEEYRNRIESLSVLITEFKDAKDQNIQLISEIVQKDIALEKYNNQIELLQEKHAGLKSELEGLKQQHTSILLEQEKHYNDELSRAKDYAELNYKTLLLSIQEESHKQIEQLQNKYNEKVQALLEKLESKSQTS